MSKWQRVISVAEKGQELFLAEARIGEIYVTVVPLGLIAQSVTIIVQTLDIQMIWRQDGYITTLRLLRILSGEDTSLLTNNQIHLTK